MSKLPGDVKKRKKAAEQATRMLDRDLVEKKLSAHVIPYSDKLFRRASIEWLVAMDQVNNSISFGLIDSHTPFRSLYRLFNTQNFRK
jgi:hypothetical protein